MTQRWRLGAGVLGVGATVALAHSIWGARAQEHAIVRELAPRSSVAGELRFHQFESHVFGNSRRLRVLLPEGYDAPANRERQYPVLYLNDGQSLFDAKTSASGAEWQVDETVQTLVKEGRIPPLLVVGIDNAGADRAAEYMPYPGWVDRRYKTDIRGQAYPAFLVDEVVPFINAHYRTLRDPNYVALGGSSLAGLISVYTAIKRPGVFGRLLIESPTLYIDDGHILLDAPKVKQWPSRVYLGIGTNEANRRVCPAPDARNKVVADVRKLAMIIHHAGVDSANIDVNVVQCAHHTEAAWASRLPTALVFLFPPTGRR